MRVGRPQGLGTCGSLVQKEKNFQALVYLRISPCIQYGVYGDLAIIYQKPCSIYLRGTITLKIKLSLGGWRFCIRGRVDADVDRLQKNTTQPVEHVQIL